MSATYRCPRCRQPYPCGKHGFSYEAEKVEEMNTTNANNGYMAINLNHTDAREVACALRDAALAIRRDRRHCGDLKERQEMIRKDDMLCQLADLIQGSGSVAINKIGAWK